MDRSDYIFIKKANGDARSVEQIGAEYDTLAAQLTPAPDPAMLAAAVKRSGDVNAALAELAKSDAARFESLRRLPFEDQAKRLGL